MRAVREMDAATEPAAPPPVMSAGQVPALDSVRGVAILLVLGYHAFITAYHGGGTPPVTNLTRALSRTLGVGWSGVVLFFVLSGYLITGILIDTRHRQRYFRVFYARRALRIFPLYYLFVAVCLAAAGAGLWSLDGLGVPPAQLLTYTQNFALHLGKTLPQEVVGVTWSLAIEEQFYVVWPVLVLLLSSRQLAAVCVFLLCAAPAMRFVIENWYVSTLPRIDGLAAGALLALLVRSPYRRHIETTANVLLGMGSGLALGFLVVDRVHPLPGEMLHTILLLPFSGLVLYAAERKRSRAYALLESPMLQLFGKYSYSIYLMHVPVLIGLHVGMARVRARDDWSVVIAGAAGALICLGAGALVYRAFEEPFLRLKSRFVP